MHPHTPATPGMPTEPNPLAQVNVGMLVIDSAGDEVGTVETVKMSGTATPDDAPEAHAERLRRAGFVKVKAGGMFGHDVYVEGGQVAEVAEVDGGMVTLNVTGDTLIRAD
jgi:hypothetical protein